MADKAAAAAAKAKGNAALTGGDFAGAVAAYTEAIGHDPNDKVFYSNRSAAYAQMKDWDKALEDGKKCVEVDPTFAKGYGRAGAAFHGLGQYAEAIDIFSKGLEVDGSVATLQQGLAAAQQAMQSSAANPIAQLFKDPANLQKLAMNPTTMGFLNQPDFVQKLQEIGQNPAKLQEHQSDERIMAALGVMLGGGGPGAPGGGEQAEAPAPAPPPPPEPAPAPPPPVELTEEEKEKLAIHEKAEERKKAATALYKAAGKLKKDPEAKAAKVKEALAAFTEAAEIEPTNMAYLNNRAACLYELKQYEDCRAECKKALEVGRENRADFPMLAKALAREGNCYFDEKDYKAAMDCYERAQMEDYQDSVHMKNQKAKKLQKKLDAAEFLDEGKSEEAKAKGNELFKAGDFQGSLKHYTEAIASVAHSSPTIFAPSPRPHKLICARRQAEP